MIIRRLLIPLFVSLLSLSASAQTAMSSHTSSSSNTSSSSSSAAASGRPSWFGGIDLGLSVGTGGLGLDLAMPVAERFRVRAGVSYIPRTNVPMSFDLMSYAGTDDDPTMDDNTKFDRMAALMEGFTGMKIDRTVDMHAKGTMVDFKLLFDVYPLRNNKHWYATVGFYWGSSKVGHIENSINEAPSLMGVVMYNRLYDYFVNEEFFDKPLYGDAYIDPMMGLEMKDKFERYGRVGAHVGDFKAGAPIEKGQPYMLTPDENGTIHADMHVNSFKPYIGIGYNTCVSKDGKWNIGFDAGALFWGRPSIRSHERYYYDPDGTAHYGTVDPETFQGTVGSYVDLATDVENISGKVGTYCDVAKAIHVYPVLNFRISYKLF